MRLEKGSVQRRRIIGGTVVSAVLSALAIASRRNKPFPKAGHLFSDGEGPVVIAKTVSEIARGFLDRNHQEEVGGVDGKKGKVSTLSGGSTWHCGIEDRSTFNKCLLDCEVVRLQEDHSVSKTIIVITLRHQSFCILERVRERNALLFLDFRRRVNALPWRYTLCRIILHRVKKGFQPVRRLF